MSRDDPKRDSGTKKREYAMAAIPEYWLIDPIGQTVTIFVLDRDADPYSVNGVFASAQQSESATLPGFRVDVQALFDQDT